MSEVKSNVVANASKARSYEDLLNEKSIGATLVGDAKSFAKIGEHGAAKSTFNYTDEEINKAVEKAKAEAQAAQTEFKEEDEKALRESFKKIATEGVRVRPSNIFTALIPLAPQLVNPKATTHLSEGSKIISLNILQQELGNNPTTGLPNSWKVSQELNNLKEGVKTYWKEVSENFMADHLREKGELDLEALNKLTTNALDQKHVSALKRIKNLDIEKTYSDLSKNDSLFKYTLQGELSDQHKARNAAALSALVRSPGFHQDLENTFTNIELLKNRDFDNEITKLTEVATYLRSKANAAQDLVESRLAIDSVVTELIAAGADMEKIQKVQARQLEAIQSLNNKKATYSTEQNLLTEDVTKALTCDSTDIREAAKNLIREEYADAQKSYEGVLTSRKNKASTLAALEAKKEKQARILFADIIKGIEKTKGEGAFQDVKFVNDKGQIDFAGAITQIKPEAERDVDSAARLLVPEDKPTDTKAAVATIKNKSNEFMSQPMVPSQDKIDADSTKTKDKVVVESGSNVSATNETLVQAAPEADPTNQTIDVSPQEFAPIDIKDLGVQTSPSPTPKPESTFDPEADTLPMAPKAEVPAAETLNAPSSAIVTQPQETPKPAAKAAPSEKALKAAKNLNEAGKASFTELITLNDEEENLLKKIDDAKFSMNTQAFVKSLKDANANVLLAAQGMLQDTARILRNPQVEGQSNFQPQAVAGRADALEAREKLVASALEQLQFNTVPGQNDPVVDDAIIAILLGEPKAEEENPAAKVTAKFNPIASPVKTEPEVEKKAGPLDALAALAQPIEDASQQTPAPAASSSTPVELTPQQSLAAPFPQAPAIPASAEAAVTEQEKNEAASTAPADPFAATMVNQTPAANDLTFNTPAPAKVVQEEPEVKLNDRDETLLKQAKDFKTTTKNFKTALVKDLMDLPALSLKEIHQQFTESLEQNKSGLPFVDAIGEQKAKVLASAITAKENKLCNNISGQLLLTGNEQFKGNLLALMNDLKGVDVEALKLLRDSANSQLEAFKDGGENKAKLGNNIKLLAATIDALEDPQKVTELETTLDGLLKLGGKEFGNDVSKQLGFMDQANVKASSSSAQNVEDPDAQRTFVKLEKTDNASPDVYAAVETEAKNMSKNKDSLRVFLDRYYQDLSIEDLNKIAQSLPGGFMLVGTQLKNRGAKLNLILKAVTAKSKGHQSIEEFENAKETGNQKNAGVSQVIERVNMPEITGSNAGKAKKLGSNKTNLIKQGLKSKKS